MMINLDRWLIGLACLSLVLAALGVQSRVHLGWLGLALWTLSIVI